MVEERGMDGTRPAVTAGNVSDEIAAAPASAASIEEEALLQVDSLYRTALRMTVMLAESGHQRRTTSSSCPTQSVNALWWRP